MQPAGVAHIFAGMPPEAVKAFGADRAAMSPAFRRAPLHDQAAHFHDYLGRLEHLLADDRPFLLGALPSIADFSAAQSIWFVRRAPPVAAHLDGYRRIDVWYERVAAFGHGTSEPMTSAEAIALAKRDGVVRALPRRCRRRPRRRHDRRRRRRPTTPTTRWSAAWSASTPSEVVVERVDERAGTVHVHFPRVGFHVKAIKKDSP